MGNDDQRVDRILSRRATFAPDAIPARPQEWRRRMH